MDVVYRDDIVKCPGCEKPIHISVGRWLGGINGFGGWVLKCIDPVKTCSGVTLRSSCVISLSLWLPNLGFRSRSYTDLRMSRVESAI